MIRFPYAQDGEPQPGKVPVQVHVYGNGDHDAALNEAEGEVNAFLDAVRLSPAPQHRRESPLNSGGSVRMYAVNDVITVEVFTESRKTGGEGFFGGILVKLNVVRNESEFRRDCMKDAPPGSSLNRHDLKLPISHSKFGGESNTRPGRPAVPGVTDEDQAEWLVLQIAKDKPLGVDPFNTEAIKIFRIAAPWFGSVVEYGLGATFPITTSAETTENRYLMSASGAVDGNGELALVNFCLCGQLVDDIPAFGVAPFGTYAPSTPDTTEYTAKDFSIYAVDFVPDSFETAYAAGGIVIAAAGNKLGALNTAEKTSTSPPVWKILDVKTRGNDFGATFTDVTSPDGTRTITCIGGSNGVGGRSGYTVSIKPVTNGFPIITGSISPGSTEPIFTVVPGIETYSKSMSGTASGLLSDPIPPLLTQSAHGYTTITQTMSCSSVYRPTEFIRRKDEYTGAVWPRETVETLTFSASNSNMSMTSESNYMSVDASSIDYTTLFSVFTEPIVPAAETSASLKLRRLVGPMYSAKVRTNWMDKTSSTIAAGSSGIPGAANFIASCTWHWGELPESYKIIRPDGATIYDWGDIKLKFPSHAEPLWGPLEAPAYVSRPFASLPVEPMNAPGAINELSYPGAADVTPPEYLASASRYHPGGYPQLGIYGSWTDPPLPYYVPDATALAPWYMNRPQDASWSFTASFNPAFRHPASSTVSAGGMASMFPTSRYADGVYQRAWAAGADSSVQAGLPFAWPVAMTDTVLLGAVQGPYRGNMLGANSLNRPVPWMGPGPVNDWYIRDPRTGGFIAQMYWAAEVPDDPAEWDLLGNPTVDRTFPISCEIIVGNDLGTVPLAALLNEWMQLGETSNALHESLPPSYNLVFIDDRNARQAMLI